MWPQDPGRSPDPREASLVFLENSLHCHQPAQAFRVCSHWYPRDHTSHLLQVPLGRGGIIWGLLGNPWQLRPCNFGRAVAGPPQAERLGENSISLAASIFHESSFLFLRPHKHVHSPAPGSSLLNHSTALVMTRVGTSI